MAWILDNHIGNGFYVLDSVEEVEWAERTCETCGDRDYCYGKFDSLEELTGLLSSQLDAEEIEKIWQEYAKRRD